MSCTRQQAILKHTGSISLCHRNTSSYTVLGWETEIRIMSPQIHNCVGVNRLLLWRILNQFRFGGRRDSQFSQMLGLINATAAGSAAHFHHRLMTSMDYLAIFHYFPSLDTCFHDSAPSPLSACHSLNPVASHSLLRPFTILSVPHPQTVAASAFPVD